MRNTEGGSVIQVEMTAERFAQLSAKLKANQGIVLNGNKGTVNAHGTQADYNFDGTELTVTVTHSPFPFSKGAAESWLRGQILSN
jgi:hypothetical protein